MGYYTNMPEMTFELQNLQLENFKCFKKIDDINFKKLTILTGANSSGKSSIIQAIVGALQSNSFPFLFSTNGKYINMGDFGDVSHMHNVNGEFYIGFTVLEPKEKITIKIKTGWKQNKLNKLSQLNSFEAGCNFFDLKFTRVGRKYSVSFNYYPKNDPDAKVEKVTLLREVLEVVNKMDKDKKGDGFNPKKFTEELYSEEKVKDKLLAIGSNGMAIIHDKKLSRIFRFLMTAFDYIGENTNLISSFRLHPNRTHLENSQDFYKIKKFGEGYLDQIIRWENSDKKKFTELISHLKKMKLIYSIKTSRLGGGRYDTIVTTHESGAKVSLSDVGFGVSQFLPILVADLQLNDHSNLIVAQPEIHLHPNVQAEFADYLIGQIDKKNKNYIIETHSEYFLNRVRLAIITGKLTPDKLAVYYIENTKGQSKVKELKFTKTGSIEGAPKSFFDTYMMDLKKIALSVEM